MTRVLRKHWCLIFCLTIIVLQFIQIIYFNRALFLKPYDTSYWKDRYEHSQYILPASHRIIGDDGLYSYGGYLLLQGASIENTNTSKPPVGIYLDGLSIAVFHNAVLLSLLIGIATMIVFFLLAQVLLKDKKLALITTALFILEPFIFSNFTVSQVDLPQLLFLLLNILFLVYAFRNKKTNYVLACLSGIALGFFTETKPPILLPIILILEGLYIFKQKKIGSVPIIFLGFAAGILIPYFKYFESGHNVRDYIKLHKYMASIYLAGKNKLFPLSIWESIFIGRTPQVVTGQLTTIDYWWPFLPLVAIFGLYESIKTLVKRKTGVLQIGSAVFLILTLLIYTLIPSYTRYLILAVPFLYIFAGLGVKKYLNKTWFVTLFILISVFGLFYSTYLLLPNPNIILSDFTYNISHKYFQDVFVEDISQSSQLPYTEQEFRGIGQLAYKQGTIQNVEFRELSKSIPIFANRGIITYRVTYTTQDLGTFSEVKTIDLVKDRGVWKVMWNWSHIVNGFKPGDSFKIKLDQAKRGTIFDKDGNITATDTSGFLISVNPSLIDTKKEQDMLKLLSSLAETDVFLQNAYLENPLPNTYIPVITTFTRLTKSQSTQLISYLGLEITPHVTRLTPGIIKNTVYDEHDSRIYSVSNYHGIAGIEKKYDTQLSGHDGGTLTLVDKNGKVIKTLINRGPKSGKDIHLH